MELKEKKILNVTTVGDRRIPKSKAHSLASKYYEKHLDKTKKSPYQDIVIASSFEEVTGSRVPSGWRKLIAYGGKYEWCESTSSYEQVLDNPNFVPVTIDNNTIWLTAKEAENLPFYYQSRDGSDWKNGGLSSMKKVHFMNKASLPPEVRLSPLCGEHIDARSINVGDQGNKLVFEKTLDSGKGYHNPYHDYFRNNYKEFDVSQYGEAGNKMFPIIQKEGDEYFAQNRDLFNGPISKFDKLLSGYSVGCEIEAFSGFVPEKMCKNLGLLPVKDGSLDGKSYEYITTVLREGVLSRLKVIFSNLNKFLAVNKSCALQYHVGGVKKDPNNVVALYKLCYILRNEMFQIIPPYRRHLDYFRSKKEIKDHCQELPAFDFFDASPRTKAEYESHVSHCYSTILTFLNDGSPNPERKANIWQHNKAGRPKWEWKSRYYAVNFLPLLFESKGTVEFRSHSGTTNPVKAINWLLLIIGIIKYAEAYSEELNSNKMKVRLIDVVEFAYNDTPELSSYLAGYLQERKFNHDMLALKGDIYGDEFIKDTTYMFKHPQANFVY